MIQPIYLYGSEVLKVRAKEADLTRKEELTQLVNDLKDTLAVTPDFPGKFKCVPLL